MATEVHHRKIGAASSFLFCHFSYFLEFGKGEGKESLLTRLFLAHEEAAGIVAGPSDGKTLMKGANLEFS
jgi:hypothetical protein